MKLGDYLIIIFAACLIMFSAYFVYISPKGNSQVLIRGKDSEWIFPLDAEELVIVAGELGDTVVRISGSRAWVESSPCENQTCVASGFVARNGQWAACLPNNVFVMIQGTESDDVDASTR